MPSEYSDVDVRQSLFYTQELAFQKSCGLKDYSAKAAALALARPRFEGAMEEIERLQAEIEALT